MEKGDFTWDEPQVIALFRQEHGWGTDATTKDNTAKEGATKSAQKVTPNTANLPGSYKTRGPIFCLSFKSGTCRHTLSGDNTTPTWDPVKHICAFCLKDGG